MKRKKLPFFKPSGSSPVKKISRGSAQVSTIDFSLLATVAVLAVFGLMMIYNASPFEAHQDLGDKYYFFKQQTISMILGFGALGFFALFDYKRLQYFALPLLLISILLLLLVFLPGIGIQAYGAHRWLRIAGFTIQPVEVIKIATVIFLATIFQKQLRVSPFMILTGLVSLIVGLLQRDLGSTIVYSMIGFGMYFVAGAPVKSFMGVLGIGFLGFIGFILAAPYRMKRVLAFLDPFADTQGFTYHISQVLIAVGSGGLFGLGIGQSRQKFAYIPEVTTDSIFSIVGEEFGFVGSVVLIALLGYLIMKCFSIAQNAPDNFGKLLAAGLTIWLGAQIAVNLSAMVSLMPLTGVPLPFISSGGSALIVNMMSVGILLNISRQSARSRV